ncbi:MAG: 7,8-didemethyl-8-hydroxy-5-deazariboflavin synthase subunit CofG [Candidatus Heimdallarchaeum endolithica]|uniref:7,8-didemethyl-8-hydroxy-5-deazariboflavin synthase n=1 Tax=Candidatus Heimdallarchaeum endolithica TaxID=2876572 RepID=A0A9Y1FNK1_9ARCH|nr:MAG: 7,8-didemethyl-8-hydroxy-5-deazariboflavin synthase subunit CofG [Candidatus Heimdallarchaeum endolithica]
MSIEEYLNFIENEQCDLLVKANEIRFNTYSNQVTFSRNYFVPVTRQCRNNCTYCSFSNSDVSSWVTPSQFQIHLAEAKKNNCFELLLTMGEKPEERYESARQFLKRYDFNSSTEYVAYLCELALEKKILPHSNLGVLDYEELSVLKTVNVSMGLMLESSSSRLLKKGMPHFNSLGKDPVKRLETIENAGKLKIPFTTGILVGIGETWKERIQSLLDIRYLSKKYDHIQEVIVQNFNPQSNTLMKNHPPPSERDFLLTVALARLILPSNVSIQVPPNLNIQRIVKALTYGANDLGGISPVTPDYINPNEPWPNEYELKQHLKQEKFALIQRLPVYTKYIKYLSKELKNIINQL